MFPEYFGFHASDNQPLCDRELTELQFQACSIGQRCCPKKIDVTLWRYSDVLTFGSFWNSSCGLSGVPKKN